MDDQACIAFLQWALPELRLRWEGFRKVRRQVCKRIGRRLRELQLPDVAAYRDRLHRRREEWSVLDGLCRVTISRFYRDWAVFSALRSTLLPELIQRMRERGESMLRIWSAGCAAGEEPYSLSIVWECELKEHIADAQMQVEIVATDGDRQSLDRAASACYPHSSVKNLPEDWRRRAFVESDGEFCLRPPFRNPVNFLCQDLRNETPPGRFDLILCRNLAFTYFEEALQRQVLHRLAGILLPDGILIVGIHESLPRDYDDFEAWSQRLGVYRRRSG